MKKLFSDNPVFIVPLFYPGDIVGVETIHGFIEGEVLACQDFSPKTVFVKFPHPHEMLNGNYRQEKIIKRKSILSMKQEPTDYITSQNKSGLKKGDKVKILRIPELREAGWIGSWSFSPNRNYIEPFKIEGDCGELGFLIQTMLDTKENISFFAPYFVLEKVKPKPIRIIDLPANCWIREKGDNRRWVYQILSINIEDNMFIYISRSNTIHVYDSAFNMYEWAETQNAEKWNLMEE